MTSTRESIGLKVQSLDLCLHQKSWSGKIFWSLGLEKSHLIYISARSFLFFW